MLRMLQPLQLLQVMAHTATASMPTVVEVRIRTKMFKMMKGALEKATIATLDKA